MVIYIDVLIFLNIITNYCILCATRRFLNLDIKHSKLLLASFTGALFTLTLLLDINSLIFTLLIKIVCISFMCFIAFFKKDIYTYIKCLFTTFVFTVIFSAVSIAYYQIFKPKNMTIINNIMYIHVKPISLILISTIIYILILISKRLLLHNSLNYTVKVKILINNAECSCIGKIDTGNSVVEPFSGAPVIIAERSLFPEVSTSASRIIPYTVLGGSGILYGIKPQKLYIDDVEINKEVYIGIYDGKIDLSFKSIINSNILR